MTNNPLRQSRSAATGPASSESHHAHRSEYDDTSRVLPPAVQSGHRTTVPCDSSDVDLLDDVFHGCAFAAYVELAVAAGGPPDVEATRRLAYRYYEAALAARHRST